MRIVPNKLNSIEELLYPVKETKIAFENTAGLYGKTNDYKAIIREDDNKLISILPKTTELVTNREVIEPVLSTIDKVGYKWDIDKSQSYYTDGKMRLTLEFPELQLYDPDSEGTNVTMNLFNSYDTSNAVKALFGAFRMICTNGMVIGQLLGKYYHKHTKGFSQFEFQIAMENLYRKIPEVNERFRILETLEINDKVMEEVDKLGKKAKEFTEHAIKTPTEASEHKEALNQLQLLNILTYYISHNVQAHRREVYQYQVSKMFGL